MTAYAERPAILPDPAERLLVVEASAGTGKTFFLEHRVIDLVLRARASIDQILVVTFTEKATAELRARIRAKLAQLATLPDAAPDASPPAGEHWRIGPDERTRLREALTAFDRAPIHTIHGFCQRLLVEDAFAGRRLFDQTQVPDEVAFLEAFHAALRDRIAVDPAERAVLAAYLRSDSASCERLGKLLLSCARRGAPVTPVLDPLRLCDAADRLRAAADALPRRGDTVKNRAIAGIGIRVRKNTCEAFANRIAAVHDAIAAVAADLDPVARAVALVSALDAIRDEFSYLDDHRDKELDAQPTGRAALDAVYAVRDAWVPIAAVAASRFLPLVLERVRATKSRRGQFDFQDMLRLVWEVLDGDRGGELAARLRQRHRWAMIDEFQDTDELQWQIFGRVWADGDDTSLTIVGDPKQAIYSFRGADVHTYLLARRELEARGARRLPLTDNYRSSADLVAAVNAIVGCTDPDFFSGDIRYDHPVRAASRVALRAPDETAAPVAPVHVLEIACEGKSPGDPFHHTLVERIADELHDLLAPPPERRLQLVERDGTRRPLEPHDCFVLTRSGAQSDDVAVALRQRGVPCAVYQREHLFDAVEAREVADLLDAIADPRDRSARLRAWTTSFFAVPLAELGGLGDVPDGHPLVALLHDWRGLALKKDLDRLFHRVLDDTRWVERTLVAGGGERAITNVLHLFELLHDEVARSPCDLHELVRRLRRWIHDGKVDRPDDVDLQRLETDRLAVQIMTIHRAKGLEAAVVLVCGGHTGPPSNDDARLYHDADGARRVLVGSGTAGDLRERCDQDIVEENERLIYVALTRAKARLYVPRVDGVPLGELTALYPLQRCLTTVLDRAADDPALARLFTVERITAGSLAPPEPVDSADDLRGWTPPPPPPDPAVDPLWAEVRSRRRGPIVTSYSRLKHAAERESDPAEVRAEDHSASLRGGPATVAVTADELPGGAATGLFLHEALEHLDLASARDVADPADWGAIPEVRRVLERAARRHGIEPRHVDVAARCLHRVLHEPVDLGDEVLPPLARAPRVAREVEFVYPLDLPGQREAFARGFIDLLVAWDDRLWVVDYKSDLVPDPGADALRAYFAAHYETQARLYAVAAARLLGITDEADCRRRLGGVLYWFLRHNRIVPIAATRADLDAWTASLARDVAAAEEVAT